MSRVPRSGAVLLLAAFTMSACQTLQSQTPAVTPAPAEAVTPAPVADAEPAPQTAALPPQQPINDDPVQLLGLNRSGVAALLGSPDLIRREAPAEIWQYVSKDCVFDVVLYARGQDYAVSYTEARDVSAAVQAPRPCLNRLLRSRQTAPVS
ncbi:MAG: hypothetical protein RH942_17880 [Kiloniellaceae bacterium]